MKLLEVLEICKQRGYPVTPRALYNSGAKHGFLIDNEDRGKYGRWGFDEEKFNAWLDKVTEKAPEGWVTLDELHNILGVSLRQAYNLGNAEGVDGVRVGLDKGKGILYVDPERVRKVIQKREQEHKEKYGGR